MLQVHITFISLSICPLRITCLLSKCVRFFTDSKQSSSAPVASADASSQRQLHGTVRSTQVFGPCFPREVFVLLAKGVTSPQVLNNMLSMCF